MLKYGIYAKAVELLCFKSALARLSVLCPDMDQWYYGRTVHELGLGPEPLYIRKKLCTKDQLKEALLDLASGKYEKRAAELSGQIRQENGIEEAIHAIEDYVHG